MVTSTQKLSGKLDLRKQSHRGAGILLGGRLLAYCVAISSTAKRGETKPHGGKVAAEF